MASNSNGPLIAAILDPRTPPDRLETLGRNLWRHGLVMVAHRKRVARDDPTVKAPPPVPIAPEVRAAALERIKGGETYYEAATDLKLSPTTVRNWLKTATGQHQQQPKAATVPRRLTQCKEGRPRGISPRIANPQQGVSGGRFFSTGQVAVLVGVSPRTVAKWCDTGALEYLRLPDSRERRIPRESLRRFLGDRAWPDPLGDAGGGAVPLRPVLLYGLAEGVTAAGRHVRREETAFDVALQIQASPPAVIVVDVGAVGPEAAGELRRWVGGRPRPRPSLVAVYPEDVEPDPSVWAAVLRRPCSAVEIAAAVERVVLK